MNTENLIGDIRAECVDSISKEYAAMFSSTEIDQYTDKTMLRLAEFWRTADDSTRSLLEGFVRLGAQNGVSSLLSMLDDKHTLETLSKLSGDLMSDFWEQEETDGRVNVF